jgi:hypothetical protein
MVVMALDPAPNDKVNALLTCPRHQLGQHLTLDHSALDLWATVVADHLYRCGVCGRELMPNPQISSSETTTTLTLNCPIHGTQNNTRTIWSVLHRRLLADAQRLRTPQPSRPTKPIPTEKPEQVPKAPSSESPEPQYCPQCGGKIRGKDNFCYHCGSAID